MLSTKILKLGARLLLDVLLAFIAAIFILTGLFNLIPGGIHVKNIISTAVLVSFYINIVFISAKKAGKSTYKDELKPNEVFLPGLIAGMLAMIPSAIIYGIGFYGKMQGTDAGLGLYQASVFFYNLINASFARLIDYSNIIPRASYMLVMPITASLGFAAGFLHIDVKEWIFGLFKRD